MATLNMKNCGEVLAALRFRPYERKKKREVINVQRCERRVMHHRDIIRRLIVHYGRNQMYCSGTPSICVKLHAEESIRVSSPADEKIHQSLLINIQ